MSDQPTPPRPAVPEPTEKKCEGCGTHTTAYKKIHLTNGALALCGQCLSDINRKNPALIAAEAALDAERNNRLAADEAMVTLHEALQKAEAALDAERRRADAGAKFKAFVHAYLTEHGVPEGDPENEHQKQGCRIGARLDWLLGTWRGLEKANDLLLKGMESQCESMDALKQEMRPLRAEHATLRQEVAGLRAGLGELLRCEVGFVHEQADDETEGCRPDCSGCRFRRLIGHARQLLDRRQDGGTRSDNAKNFPTSTRT